MPMKLNEYPAVKVGIFDSGHEDFELKMAANVDPRDAYPENRIFFSLPNPQGHLEDSCVSFSMTPEAALEHVKRVQQAVVDVKLATGRWFRGTWEDLFRDWPDDRPMRVLLADGNDVEAVIERVPAGRRLAALMTLFGSTLRGVGIDLHHVRGWRLA